MDEIKRSELVDIFRRGSQALLRERDLLPLFDRPQGDFAPGAMRGIFDRRAMAFAGLSGDGLSHLPKFAKSRAAWLAMMDVYGDVHDAGSTMIGLRDNIAAARRAVVDADTAMPGYDIDSAVIAWDFMRRQTPDFDARLPEIAAALTPDRIEHARHRSAFHILMSMRLDKDGDLLALTRDDPNAFAFRVSALMQRAPDEEEQALLILLGFLPGGLPGSVEGFVSPRILFEKRAEIDRLEADLKKDLAQKGVLKKLALNRLGKEQDNRKERRLRNRRAGKLVRDELAIRARQLDVLNKEYKHIQRLEKTYRDQVDGMLGTVVDDTNAPRSTLSGVDLSYYKVSPSVRDRLSQAQDLITPEQAAVALDGLYREYGKELTRANAVGRRLRAHLLAPREMRIDRDLEEGMLDPATLPMIVQDPSFDRAFMQRRDQFGAGMDTHLTILIDNSGSMSGAKIALAFVAAERLSYWIANTGVKTEVLGFTTTGNGSRAPGGVRGIPTHHIIYKTANEPHTARTTQRMAAMLQKNLLQANADGEAVIWAYNRCVKSPCRRRLLMVLSDGKPSAGHSEAILQRHLTDVVRHIESGTQVEIIGIGIQTDVSKFYCNSIKLNSPHELLTTMAERLKLIVDRPEEYDRRLQRSARALRPAPGLK